MVDRVLFQMWGPFRAHLIASHNFYVAEARKRLLDQFTNESMKADADQFAEDWLVEKTTHFNPDHDDPASCYEQAWDESITYFGRLDELRKTTRLSLVAGMYHEWEKQLRDWISRECGELRLGENAHKAIWGVTLEEIFDFLEAWQWGIRAKPYYQDLMLCRLIVNIYKHGAGPSYEELKVLDPELAGKAEDLPGFFLSALNYTNLKVGDAEIERFSNAIVAFWEDTPENTFSSQVGKLPKWLTKAMRKDDAK